MKKRIYAVWLPGQEQKAVFFPTWESCKPHVEGISDIRYRGFPDQTHAEEFLGIKPPDHGLKENKETLFADKAFDETLIIYTDGSYLEGYPYAGWSWVALIQNERDEDILLGEDQGVTPEPAVSRNIDGELIAVLEAVRWAENYLLSRKSDWDKTRVVVFYDYLGIAKWAQGNWKAKTPLTQHFQQEMIPYRHKIHFQKITAHAGKKWNEYVDRQAKQAVRKKPKP